MSDLKGDHEMHEIAAVDNNINVDDGNVKAVGVEHSGPEEKAQAQQMLTKSDDLPIWESVKRYKLVSLLAMVAAFSASLDGYRKSLLKNFIEF